MTLPNFFVVPPKWLCLTTSLLYLPWHPPTVESFSIMRSPLMQQSTFPLTKTTTTSHTRLSMVIEVGPTDDDLEPPPAPGKMKLSEIKSELDLRRVSYSDCFDRESLELRLNEARCSGKADPSIIDNFNRGNLEANIKGEPSMVVDVNDDMLEGAVGGDGTLPGGMPPEMLKSMLSDPELVNMLRSTKVQEAMKLVMEGGQQALEEVMKNDRETYECVRKLNLIMGKLNQN